MFLSLLFSATVFWQDPSDFRAMQGEFVAEGQYAYVVKPCHVANTSVEYTLIIPKNNPSVVKSDLGSCPNPIKMPSVMNR